MSNKFNIQLLTMGSAALIVSAGAMAGTPSAPVTALSTHMPSMTFAIDNGGLTYNGLGELSGATCGVAGSSTCTAMDGNGDGMLQFLVKDTITGKAHIETIVGSNDDDGLFLNDNIVRYGGGTSLNAMANKQIIKDPTEVAAADTGFRLNTTWLRGEYQTFQPAATNNATASGGGGGANGGASGTRMDSWVDMNIGGVQTFTAEGQAGENGDFSIGGIVDIQQGTTAANTSTNAADAQAMGVFHMRSQGGTSATAGPINYQVGATPGTITLDGQSLVFAPTDGVVATYIHQQGFGYNYDPTLVYDNFNTDLPDLPGNRDFAYINIHKVANFPSVALGTFADPMFGEQASTGQLVFSSQQGEAAVYNATTVAQNTAPQAGLTTAQNGIGNNDWTTSGTQGNFTSANATNILNAWNSLF